MNKTDMEHFQELDLSSKATGFIDLKRCFKVCVKDMGKRHLDEKEDMCSTNCLNKYQQTQTFLSQKMNNELNKLILMDPKIKSAFASDKKRFGS